MSKEPRFEFEIVKYVLCSDCSVAVRCLDDQLCQCRAIVKNLTQTSETGLLTRAPTARLKRNKRRKSSDWGSQPGTYAAGLGIMNRWRLISHEWAHSLSCTFSGLCSLLTTTSAFQYYTLSVPTSDSAQTNQPERNLGLQKLHKSIRFCLKRWAWRLYCTTDELRVDWAGASGQDFQGTLGKLWRLQQYGLVWYQIADKRSYLQSEVVYYLFSFELWTPA